MSLDRGCACDGIFGDDPAISLNDRGGINLVDQCNIHSRANVQTSCNVRHQVRHLLTLLRDYQVRRLERGKCDGDPLKQRC